MTLEHRPAAPASITYEEFVQAVVAGQADQAIDEVRKLRESQPDHVLLNETYLRRLAFSLRNTWGLTEEATHVMRLNEELNPAPTPTSVAEFTDEGAYGTVILVEPTFGNFQLEEHLELVRCYYNFVRPHRALRFGRETRTPAMQAGLAARRLTFREVFVCTLTLLIEKVMRAFRGARTRAADTDVQMALAA